MAFNLIWWSFGDDFLYYGWAESGLAQRLGIRNFEGPGSLMRVINNGAGHAYWTFLGKIKDAKRGEVINGKDLAWQALLGAALAGAIVFDFVVDSPVISPEISFQIRLSDVMKTRGSLNQTFVMTLTIPLLP